MRLLPCKAVAASISDTDSFANNPPHSSSNAAAECIAVSAANCATVSDSFVDADASAVTTSDVAADSCAISGADRAPIFASDVAPDTFTITSSDRAAISTPVSSANAPTLSSTNTVAECAADFTSVSAPDTATDVPANNGSDYAGALWCTPHAPIALVPKHIEIPEKLSALRQTPGVFFW